MGPLIGYSIQQSGISLSRGSDAEPVNGSMVTSLLHTVIAVLWEFRWCLVILGLFRFCYWGFKSYRRSTRVR